MTSLREQSLLHLYFRGDRLGAPFEGAMPGTVTVDGLLRSEMTYPQGTDESDIVRCMVRYLREHDATKMPLQVFSCKWAEYHEGHRAATRYGRGWRDYFATVRAVRDSGASDIEKFRQLHKVSKDRRSAGNGCLALAVPLALRFARERSTVTLGLEAASTIARLSHFEGTNSCSELYIHLASFFDSRKSSDWWLDDVKLSFQTEASRLGTASDILAPGCALAAIAVSEGETLEDCLEIACKRGGDMDSYLSLGLFLWGLKKIPRTGGGMRG